MGSLRHHIARVLPLAVSLAVPAHAAMAQETPAYISVVDGAASFERDGGADAAVSGMPIIDGDRLSTGAGRLEVIFADGSVLDVDEYSSVEVGPPPRFRVTSGRAMLSAARGEEPFAAGRGGAFEQWVRSRREERFGETASAQYLPPGLQSYGGAFDRGGAWQYEGSYGYVWYPAVEASWRPYYNGYWSSLRPYGWTWIGFDPWAWPTHHYGRWGHARDRWFWIPGRTWGPAWVTWASAPGYVSWCPLGFDNRPVFSLNVNIGQSRTGWITLDRSHFGVRGAPVNRYALEDRRPPARTRPAVPAVAPRPAGRTSGRATTPPRGSRPAAPAAERGPQRDPGRRPSVADRGVPRVERARPRPQSGERTVRPPAPIIPAAADRRPAPQARSPRPQAAERQPQVRKAMPERSSRPSGEAREKARRR